MSTDDEVSAVMAELAMVITAAPDAEPRPTSRELLAWRLGHTGDWPYRDPETPLSEDQRLMRKRVLAQVESEPESFSMYTWESRESESSGSCGTTRCVSGWAVHFAQQDGTWEHGHGSTAGIVLLGLTRAEAAGQHDGVSLFYDSDQGALERLRELARA
jgi:hypothetical protein